MPLDSGDTLIAVKSYFDGSHNGVGWNRAKFITLAGFAGDDSLLGEFDQRWKDILADDSRRPTAPYLHMKELRKKSGPFGSAKGWNDELRARLIIDLLMYLQTLDKGRCNLFACSVDTEAHARSRLAGKKIASPIQLCVHFSPHIALAWYVQHYRGLFTSAHYFFDINEPFRHHFERLWRSKKKERLDITGNREAWQLVKSVNAIRSIDEPAMQLADLLAWATNRNLSASEGDFMKHLEYIVKQIVPSSSIHLDDENLEGVVFI